MQTFYEVLHEDYGHYSYTEHYSLGDIFIYTSADEEKGVLLELKGRGCRQFESYLLAQQRSWYDFLMDALIDGGVMKRIDLAINDHTGILDIPELAEKCRKREYIGKSRSYKFYQSGELIKPYLSAFCLTTTGCTRPFCSMDCASSRSSSSAKLFLG